jgi:predicted XRE-type DNA-binding protein
MRNPDSALNSWSHLQCQAFNTDHIFSVRFVDLEDGERGLKIVDALLRYRKGLEQINCWLTKGDVSKEEAAEVLHIFKSQWLSENRGAIEVNSH